MTIETKATRSTRRHEGLPVWYGHYRIDDDDIGMPLGWTYATNPQGERIAYQDRESALAGARVCAEATRADTLAHLAEWAESKAAYWSESDKPWAMRNMRLYQNYASRYWAEHFKAKRVQQGELP